MRSFHSNRVLPLAALTLCFLSITQRAFGYWGGANPIIEDNAVTKLWSYETNNWMGTIPDNTKLGDITLPSSHDAGMNEECDLHPTLLWATQYETIYKQMEYGARFFDIRFKIFYHPDLLVNQFRCAHGTGATGLLWEYGHTLDEVMNDAVSFVTDNPTEVVILKLSHWVDDSDVPRALDKIFAKSEWTAKLYKSGTATPPMLNNITLGELRGKIILLLDRLADNVSDEPVNANDDKANISTKYDYVPANGVWRFGDMACKSNGKYGYYRLYDSYSDSKDYYTIVCKQRDRLKDCLRQNGSNSTEGGFMLCWQETSADGSVYNGAAYLNVRLERDLALLTRLFNARPRQVNIDYIDRNVCKIIINANKELFSPTNHPSVPYLDPVIDSNGKVTGYVTKYCNDYSVLTGDYPWTMDLEDRWYVVDGNCTCDCSIEVSGNAHIILKNGATLTATPKANSHWAGIITRDRTNYPTAALTVYGQSSDQSVMGQISAQGDTYGAGIGGSQDWPGHYITINGGKITATGGENGSGIGGGKNSDANTIVINGGFVTANSGGKGAGIGGGYGGSGHGITINGGFITANGYNGGAAIGGGEQNNGGGAGDGIVINGGTIDAHTAWHTHNIGSGNDGPKQADDVKFNGGSIWATSGDSWGPYQPINGSGNRVYDVMVPDCEASSTPVTVSGLATFGVHDIYPIDNKLIFYLPNGTYNFAVGNKVYKATVNNSSVTAAVQTPVAIIVGSSGYATFYSDKKLMVPSEVEAFVYSFDNSSNSLLPQLVPAGSILPANTGFVVKAKPGTYNFIDFSTETAGTFTSVLQGVTTETATSTITGGTKKIYVLGTIDGQTTFYEYTGDKVPAGKAYYLAN